MGTVRAQQLCWSILGFLLLQGHTYQLTTEQPSITQGAFSTSLITEPTSPSTGESPSSEPKSPSPLSSTGTPATPEKALKVPSVANKSMMPRSSTMDGHSPSSLGLTWPQSQQHTSGLDTSQNVTPKSATMSPRTREASTILPSPTSETVLTVAAFGVISFIVILVVVVIILVSVVSLRFKCRKNKESEDPQKPGSSGLSESCSTANGEKDSITLISMKNINMNNSKGCPSAEKVHFSWFPPPFHLFLSLGVCSLSRKEILSKTRALLSPFLHYHFQEVCPSSLRIYFTGSLKAILGPHESEDDMAALRLLGGRRWDQERQ
ncbi:endothelial cell-specific chemotaxis regulator isoform X1 [Rousettus aegyptiacus]|uniref:endothelial cell-specific chemotaxis regulator isoform X1 n=1 Tax=Rousettus aegyptiacus TaxID=9407 RepID=UPI00168D0AAF|nr:endothelial cell-specific chemotaxis regulator isoform X1 [Rousettus aegyptiacus]